MPKDQDRALLADQSVIDAIAKPVRKKRKSADIAAAVIAGAHSYKSALEFRATGQIRGWVYNPGDHSEKLAVRLFVDDVEVAATIADQPEPKLNVTDKNHRFWFVVPDRFHDGQPHRYRVEVGETGEALRQLEPDFTLANKENGGAVQLSGSVAFKSGWLRGHALDASEPRDNHVVNLFIDGKFAGSALADETRADVQDVRQGHFFNFPVPVPFWDGLPHVFAAVVDGSETWLEAMRETFTIPKLSGVIGELESVANGIVTGWAANTLDPERKVEILVRIDGTVEVRTPAVGKYDPLTLANGAIIARHGFSVPLPERFYDGQQHEIIVHLADKSSTARSLCGTTFRISRPLGLNREARFRVEMSRKSLKESEVVYDIVFVLNINSKGWILEKICRTICDQLGLNAYFTFTERNGAISGWLPRARAYFFGHYKLLTGALKSGADIGDAARFVWFTHPVFDQNATRDELHASLSAADHIFTANTRHREALAFMGLPPQKITTVLGGADPGNFSFKRRTGRGVGVVGAYYKRKNPELMLAAARAMPDTPFLLLAPKATDVENKLLLWTHWPRLGEFKALPNTRYVEAAYEDFARYFDEFDIYLSVSDLEGGPIPLIEAMFSNCVPVVTRTGFAEDVVTDGVNGYLVPIGVNVDELVAKIRQAGLNDSDVRSTVVDFTWSGFGSAIAAVIARPVHAGESINLGLGHGAGMRLREGWARQDDLGAIADGGPARIALPLTEALLAVTLCVDFEAGESTATVELAVDRSPIAMRTLEPGKQELRFDLPSLRPATAGLCNITINVHTLRGNGSDGATRPQVRVRSLTLIGVAA